MRFSVLLMAALLVLAGCGQADSPVERQERGAGQRSSAARAERPADVPAYEVTADRACPASPGNQDARCFSVSTDATSGEDIGAVTEDLRFEHPDENALVVTAYPNEPTAEQSGTGFAFSNEDAARAVLSSMYANPGEADVEGQVRQAMDDGGLYVISIEDMVREITESMEMTAS